MKVRMIRWIVAGAVLLGLTGQAEAQGFAFAVGGVTPLPTPAAWC